MDCVKKKAVKIACLTPSHGVESRSIAPPHGVEGTVTTLSHGAIEGYFCYFSTPPDGDHLEKPSVPGFKKLLHHEQVGREIVRCRLAATPPEMQHHQGLYANQSTNKKQAEN